MTERPYENKDPETLFDTMELESRKIVRILRMIENDPQLQKCGDELIAGFMDQCERHVKTFNDIYAELKQRTTE